MKAHPRGLGGFRELGGRGPVGRGRMRGLGEDPNTGVVSWDYPRGIRSPHWGIFSINRSGIARWIEIDGGGL